MTPRTEKGFISAMARYTLERGPVPLHHQVYLDLAGALSANEWTRGERLPTERELAAQYGCSLITVRRALDELTRQGRLERKRGRGTFVTVPPIVRDITGPAGFADEMRALGYRPSSVVMTAREEPAPLAAARSLGIEVGAPVHYVERIRAADGMPLLLEQVRLPAAVAPGLLERELGGDVSLWEVLRRDYDLPVLRRQEILSAVIPTTREARLLDLHGRPPAVEFEGIAYTRDGRPIEHSRTVVSPQRARYYVESGPAPGRRVAPLAADDAGGRETELSDAVP